MKGIARHQDVPASQRGLLINTIHYGKAAPTYCVIQNFADFGFKLYMWLEMLHARRGRGAKTY